MNLNDVLYRNLEGLNKIDEFMNGIGQTLPEEISEEMGLNLKFCPVKLVNVERSFSVFILIKSKKCHKFTAAILERYVFAY